ncbi:MAG: hypothetical protein N2035_08965 [Chthoniobacterales bacterium]|nr:hypothetical protein [Chthoniobacterales bacterium]
MNFYNLLNRRVPEISPKLGELFQRIAGIVQNSFQNTQKRLIIKTLPHRLNSNRPHPERSPLLAPQS